MIKICKYKDPFKVTQSMEMPPALLAQQIVKISAHGDIPEV